MFIKKERNQVVQIDDWYSKNFSFTKIKEKVDELKTHFEEDALLDYFLTRTNVDSIDTSITKYAYPIFLLSEDTLKKNSEKIVHTLPETHLLCLAENIGEEKINIVMRRYCFNKLSNFKEVDFTEIQSFLKKDSSLSKHIDYLMENTPEMEDILINIIKYISDTKLENDYDIQYYQVITYILEQEQYFDFSKKKWQDLYLFILLESNENVTTDIHFYYDRMKLTREAFMVVIEYFSRLKKMSNRDTRLVQKTLKEIITHYPNETTTIDSLISILPKRDLKLWTDVLILLKDVDFPNIEQYLLDFCLYIVDKIKFSKMNKQLQNAGQFLRHFGVFVNNPKLNSLVVDIIKMNKNTVLAQKTFQDISYGRNLSNEQQMFQHILFFDLMYFLTISTNDSENNKEFFIEVLMNSKNEMVIKRIGQTLDKSDSPDIYALMKVKQLIDNPTLLDFHKKDLENFIEHLDINSNEDLFNQLIATQDKDVHIACNKAILKQINGRV